MTLDEYNAAELEARCGLSFAEIMAFAPRTFEELGFPHRVEDERELVRYADWNRDFENRYYFEPDHFFAGPAVRTIYTLDEVDAMNRVRDQAVEVTRKLGRAVRPVCGPFAQLGHFRVLASFGLDGLRVFEVGPGTAYLGALLVNEAIDYYGFTDNAQALFLWQTRMMEEVGRRDVGVPWWRFARGEGLPQVDVVVSNSNLGEMTRDALRITAHRARAMLEGSRLGLFMFSSVGYPRHNPIEAVEGELRHAGFRKAFEKQFRGYVPNGHPPTREDGDIPLFNPSGRPELLTGAQAVSVPADQRPLDLDVTKILEGWEPPQ